MIVDRYNPVNLFALVPQLGTGFDAPLRQLDQLLDDDVIFQRVKADLVTAHPHSSRKGRHSTPVEVILRMLLVRRLYHWSYEETEHFVADSLVLRQFCRVYLEAVPDDTTLIRSRASDWTRDPAAAQRTGGPAGAAAPRDAGAQAAGR